jgi:isoleucyl-tRNA synthetase
LGFFIAKKLKNKQMKTKTLNMPQTDFSQRSNSQKREPELLSLWNTKKVFDTRNELNTDKEFVLHDGPPYANGDVHVGHVLNKVLKDMTVKYHLMNGNKVHFVPGSDCHGLPTELAVQKKHGRLDTKELREKCSDWAKEYSQKQNDTFKEFGVFAQWDKPYLTMNKDYEYKQLEVLYNFLNKRLVYLDNRPVHYSPSSRTVLAESELEYKTRTDLSAYFTFDLEDGRKLLLWTTQPWTLLGNVAVCVNPDMDYLDVELNNSVYVVAKSREFLLNGKVLKEYKGSELDKLKYTNKFSSGLVLCDRFVKSDSGTGLVHLCPSHGEDDYEVCKKNGLSGKDLTDLSGKLDNGLFCLDKGSEWVVSEMGDMLFKSESYEHSYPHDWRTGGPVYFKLTEQFFLDLSSLKEEACKALEEVEFSDDKWKRRLLSMLNTRDRWCLSRQRKWGFPLAVFLKDGKPFLNDNLEKHLVQLFKDNGSDVWFNNDVEYLLPDEFKNLNLVKCDYTLDVWFDSGVSWYSVVGKQSDVYFEGSDQHRGWFQSSLLTSVAMNGKSPYKKLMTHGFVLDEHGRKMSKSLGNVVNPKDVTNKYNTDVLRLWASVVNYNTDVQLGDDVLKNCGDYYFKFRNTLKYLLGNMYGYDSNVKFELTSKDTLALDRCDLMYKDTLNSYSNMNFRKAFDDMMSWVNEYSKQYLDVETKSYLYEYDLNSLERQRCQYVLKYTLERFMKVLAPMCSFLAEDAYQNYLFKSKDSVFLEEL